MPRDWEVELKGSQIGDTGILNTTGVADGAAAETVWTIGGDAAKAAGEWSGTLRNNGDDGVPQVATGTFLLDVRHGRPHGWRLRCQQAVAVKFLPRAFLIGVAHAGDPCGGRSLFAGHVKLHTSAPCARPGPHSNDFPWRALSFAGFGNRRSPDPNGRPAIGHFVTGRLGEAGDTRSPPAFLHRT